MFVFKSLLCWLQPPECLSLIHPPSRNPPTLSLLGMYKRVRWLSGPCSILPILAFTLPWFSMLRNNYTVILHFSEFLFKFPKLVSQHQQALIPFVSSSFPFFLVSVLSIKRGGALQRFVHFGLLFRHYTAAPLDRTRSLSTYKGLVLSLLKYIDLKLQVTTHEWKHTY